MRVAVRFQVMKMKYRKTSRGRPDRGIDELLTRLSQCTSGAWRQVGPWRHRGPARRALAPAYARPAWKSR
jgi:hypothetical protein